MSPIVAILGSMSRMFGGSSRCSGESPLDSLSVVLLTGCRLRSSWRRYKQAKAAYWGVTMVKTLSHSSSLVFDRRTSRGNHVGQFDSTPSTGNHQKGSHSHSRRLLSLLIRFRSPHRWEIGSKSETAHRRRLPVVSGGRHRESVAELQRQHGVCTPRCTSRPLDRCMQWGGRLRFGRCTRDPPDLHGFDSEHAHHRLEVRTRRLRTGRVFGLYLSSLVGRVLVCSFVDRDIDESSAPHPSGAHKNNGANRFQNRVVQPC